MKLQKKLMFHKTIIGDRVKRGSGTRVQFASHCFKWVPMFLDRGAPKSK